MSSTRKKRSNYEESERIQKIKQSKIGQNSIVIGGEIEPNNQAEKSAEAKGSSNDSQLDQNSVLAEDEIDLNKHQEKSSEVKGSSNDSQLDQNSVLAEDEIEPNKHQEKSSEVKESSNDTQPEQVIIMEDLDEFCVEIEETETVKQSDGFLKIAQIENLQTDNIPISFEGRLFYAYKICTSNGKQVNTIGQVFYTFPIILIDDELENQIKVTFWGARAHEFASRTCKYFDLIRVHNGTLKKIDSKYNWGNVQYAVDVGEKSKFELLFSPFDYIKLPFSQLNDLPEKRQVHVRGVVSFDIRSSIPKQVQVKSKYGSVWIKFWNDDQISKLKKGKIYAFIGFFCKEASKGIENEAIFVLNDSKYSLIIPIQSN